jgi:putative ABC transport system permease protein
MVFENFRIAWIALMGNRTRSVLTMLGIIIGVWAVVILLSAGDAFEDFVVDEFTSIGTNLIFTFPVADENGELDPFTMTIADAIADPSRAPDVQYVSPRLNVDAQVIYDGDDANATITGVTPSYMDVELREVVLGQFIDQEDIDLRTRVAVIGPDVVEDLFESEADALGAYIRIGSTRFQIIGILDETEGGPGGGGNDEVLVPLTTAQTKLGSEQLLSGERTIGGIVMQTYDSDVALDAADQVTQILRTERDLAPDADDNFFVLNQTEVLDSLTVIIDLLTIFLGVIAGISLLVGGIGVMNIMLVTVTERTREIGLRKAVGARANDIVTQFLVESVVISVAGGLIGVLLAYGLAEATNALTDIVTVNIAATSVALALSISAAVGIFFGIYPAQRAAKLKPIDALHYE